MSELYFLDFRKKQKENYLNMLEKLIEAAGGLGILKQKTPVAVKTHFGEDGNLNFVSPLYIRRIVNLIKKYGAQPFLIDTTTLYSGRRFRGDSHLELAKEHGFDFAPVIIGDGIHGDEYFEIDGSKIAIAFKNIDTMFCISHFKGHLVTGFGAALKNIGMGCASKGGKLHLHSRSRPYVDKEKCIFCLKCYNYCAYGAIAKEKSHVIINPDKCSGCAGCMSVCPERAIKFYWSAASDEVQKGIAQYTAHIVRNKKIFYLNFLTNITPDCDCLHTSEPPICADIGILAGFDPVAIDQASYDMVKKEIDRLRPDIDSQVQLYYGEKFGAGERRYEIKNI
ncbi:MAG: DUF362 domain-containing protein [candidate division WOR-3 bacterium]|nr:DUF362 domain-containing protein [candidate division WOR-3 bacterium]